MADEPESSFEKGYKNFLWNDYNATITMPREWIRNSDSSDAKTWKYGIPATNGRSVRLSTLTSMAWTVEEFALTGKNRSIAPGTEIKMISCHCAVSLYEADLY